MIGLNSMSVAVWTRMNEKGLPVNRQYEEERVDGRSMSEIRGEDMREFVREKCASGVVFQRSNAMTTERTTTELLVERAKQFVALRELDNEILSRLKGKPEPCMAKVAQIAFHLSGKHAPLPYELPLIMREATIIED